MKKLSTLRLALVFAGCFMGAGYVSGQELWQFFGAYGLGGLFGMVIAAVLIGGFGLLVLRLCALTGERRFDKILVPWNAPVLRFLAGLTEVLLLFGIVAIMSAGIGALLERLLGLSHYLGSLLFCAAVLLIALLGLSGLVSALSFSVPVLLVVTVAFGVYALCTHDLSALPSTVASGENPLLGNWFFSALTFFSYNFFGAVSVLTPLSDLIDSGKTMRRGVWLGVFEMVLIALCVLLCVGFTPSAAEAELPMLEIASGLGTPFLVAYALLLVLAMFGAALSCFIGMMDYLKKKFPPVEKHHAPISAVLTVLAYVASLAGFGDLIGTIYPIFGYLSAVFLVTLLIHYIMVRRGKAPGNSPASPQKQGKA